MAAAGVRLPLQRPGRQPRPPGGSPPPLGGDGVGRSPYPLRPPAPGRRGHHHPEGYTEEEKLFTETEAVQTLREAARDWEEENLSDAVIKEREETFRVEERDGGRVGVLEIRYLAEMDIAQPRKLEVVPPADDQSSTG